MQIYGVELELWLGLLVAISALVIWGMKRYETVMADGKVSLKEVISTIEDSESLIDNVTEKAEAVQEAYNKHKKAELIEMCKEKGLPTSGTKAELVARLEEAAAA
jgi:hypothetical protein